MLSEWLKIRVVSLSYDLQVRREAFNPHLKFRLKTIVELSLLAVGVSYNWATIFFFVKKEMISEL